MTVTQTSSEIYQDYSSRRDQQSKHSVAVIAGKTCKVARETPVSEVPPLAMTHAAWATP